MSGARGAALAAAYAHGPGKSVRVSGTWREQPRPRPAGAALRGLTGGFAGAVRAVLDTALAPRRFEPWAAHNDHRAFPSARAAHLHTAALRVPGRAARTLDPVRGLLLGPDPLPRAAVEAAGTVTVELSAAPERLRPGYGSLRDAIALLETGHVVGALVEAAAAHGLLAVATLHPDAAAATGGRAAGSAGPVASVVLAPGTAPAWPLARVTAPRSSGLAPCGLTADPRPLDGAALDRLVADAVRTPPGSPAAPSGPGARLRHRLMVRGVTGRADGVHVPGPPLARTGPAPDDDGLRALFAVPPSGFDVPGLPVVWLLTADVAGAVGEDGPDAYATLLLAAGAAAQHVCSAAAAHGLFCRPVRGVDDNGAEAAAGVGPGQDLLYALLLGRPRLPVHAPLLAYDLSDPEPPGDPEPPDDPEPPGGPA